MIVVSLSFIPCLEPKIPGEWVMQSPVLLIPHTPPLVPQHISHFFLCKQSMCWTLPLNILVYNFNLPQVFLGGLFKKGVFFALTLNFYKKDKNIYSAFQFFKSFKPIVLGYKISAPFSLVEAKTHLFNIYIN